VKRGRAKTSSGELTSPLPATLPPANGEARAACSPVETRGRILLLLLLAAFSFVPAALGQETSSAPTPPAATAENAAPSVAPSPLPEEEPPSFLGGITGLFDNDTFSGNDSAYTAGLAFAWTSAATETYGKKNLHRKIVDAFSFLPTVNEKGYRNYLQFLLGSEMYTASNIRLADPPPGDHPYAGVLYLDSTIMSMSSIANHQLTLRLGFVGPASGASEVQKWVHEMIGSPIPEGWDTQLKNEPIVNLYYQYSRRLLRRAPSNRGGFDFTWNGGGGLGNYYIGANVGLMARVGYRLPDNYGVTPLVGRAESLPGVPPPRKRFCIYAFLSGQAFGVVRYLPTDGNTFVESRSGERGDWYASLSGGVVVGYSRVLLGYRYHGIAGLTDPENFKSEKREDFGTIMLTVFLG
jgi:lipid A 3-O-deacylase